MKANPQNHSRSYSELWQKESELSSFDEPPEKVIRWAVSKGEKYPQQPGHHKHETQSQNKQLVVCRETNTEKEGRRTTDDGGASCPMSAGTEQQAVASRAFRGKMQLQFGFQVEGQRAVVFSFEGVKRMEGRIF